MRAVASALTRSVEKQKNKTEQKLNSLTHFVFVVALEIR